MIGHYTIGTNRAVNVSSFLDVPLLIWDLSLNQSPVGGLGIATFDSLLVGLCLRDTQLLWITFSWPVHAYTGHMYLRHTTQPPRRSTSNSSNSEDRGCVCACVNERTQSLRIRSSAHAQVLVRACALNYATNSFSELDTKNSTNRLDSNPRPLDQLEYQWDMTL